MDYRDRRYDPRGSRDFGDRVPRDAWDTHSGPAQPGGRAPGPRDPVSGPWDDQPPSRRHPRGAATDDDGTSEGTGRHARGATGRGRYVPSGEEGSAPPPVGQPRRVWRPTRGPRRAPASDTPPPDPGFGAPERGWRTADGGYRTPTGRWRAPYRPYDTGEWQRDARLDTEPTGGGQPSRYPPGTGEMARYRDDPPPASTDPGTGEIRRYRPGPDRYPDGNQPDEDETGRIPRQRRTPGPVPPPAPAAAADDPPDRYSYDPLTLGGGSSPAMRYDRDSDTFGYRPPADAPRRRQAARPDPEPPGRRRPARPGPPQRFEGTYPPRVRRPGNLAPVGTRPLPTPDEDPEVAERPGYLYTMLVTTAWFTIPLLIYTMYVLTLDGSAEAGDGSSPRQDALNGLLSGMPRVGVALLTSLAVAMLVRLIAPGWRAATTGFAAAVVGGGVAAIMFTALQG